MRFNKLDIAISILSLTLFIGSLLLAFQSTEIVKEKLNLIKASVSSRGINGFYTKENGHDFGIVRMSDGKIKYNFSIRNNGENPFTISKVYTSCECAKVYLTEDKEKNDFYGMFNGRSSSFLNKEIKPKGFLNLEMYINTAIYCPFGVGMTNPSVYIEDTNGGLEKLNFSVIVIP